MADQEPSRKLAVIVHADVVDSTALVQRNETLAHKLINEAFQRFSSIIQQYGGTVHEIRGDALVAEFARASDAVCAAVCFQQPNTGRNTPGSDDMMPKVRIGIALGEEVFAHDTVTGAGVVLAQRVEQLSEPGGVCVTGAIHEAIPQRLPFEQESLGEQTLKGFDEPVRVYRVALRAGAAVPSAETDGRIRSPSQRRRLALVFAAIALVVIGGVVFWLKPWAPQFEPASVERMTFPLPDKPSIAVLPFTNMSGDAQQEYFTDGITEDLITDLSKIPSLFVIARNSTFAYKGKAVRVQQIAKDLGVRYVLEGSVQRAGEQVRINAQLIDATTGGHIWAERYDGSMIDVFGLQDQVTQKIVTALSLNLTATEPGRREQTKNPQAYDAFLQGWALYRRFSADDFARAIPHFQDAVRLDSNYGRAYAALASVYWESWRQGESWTSKVSPTNANYLSFTTARFEAEKYLKVAMRNPSPLAYRVASAINWDYRRFDEAIAEAERALALDPNDPDGDVALAWALIFSGRPQEALPAVERAMRLDPLHPKVYMYVLGMSRLGLGQFEEAVAALEHAHKRSPDDRDVNIPLAVAYERLGRHELARAALKRYTAVWSGFSTNVDGILSWWPFKRETDIRRFGESLVAAGLCCAELLEQYVERVRQGGTLQ
jgi:adenylate cyclase